LIDRSSTVEQKAVKRVGLYWLVINQPAPVNGVNHSGPIKGVHEVATLP
jgi:hypothetical protein